MNEVRESLTTARSLEAVAQVAIVQGSTRQGAKLLEMGLVAVHSACYGVLREYARRAFPQSALRERRETMAALQSLSTGGNEGLDVALASLREMAARRDDVLYLDPARESDPVVLGRWLRESIAQTRQCLEAFGQAHVRRHHPALRAERRRREGTER